jgi:hypothetical protein
VKGAKDSDKDATSYRHPVDAKHYAVSPQYFLERAKVPLPVFAKDFKLDLHAVEVWAANQARRGGHNRRGRAEGIRCALQDARS